VTATVTKQLRGRLLTFEVSLKPPRPGCWYIVMVSGAALEADPLVSLIVEDSRAGASGRCFIPIRFAGRTLARILLICVQGDEQRMVIEVHGARRGPDPRLRLMVVPQIAAAVLLIGLQPSLVLPNKAGRRMNGQTSFRQRLSLAAVRLGPRISYLAWRRRYDCWKPAGGNPVTGTTMALVFTRGDQDRAALNATIDSLVAAERWSNLAVPCTIVDGASDNSDVALRTALDSTAADFVIVLQAGEMVSPHAIGALVRFAEIKHFAIVYADEDRQDFAGDRSHPLFKPEASRMLMLSGGLATGVFLIRLDELKEFNRDWAGYADALRLDAWLRLDAKAAQGNAAFSGRLPLILTHRRPDTFATPPDVVAAVARAHLGSAWMGEIAAAQLPLQIRPAVGVVAPKVSLIVASTGRLGHVRHCLAAVLENTAYPQFEMVIVLSQNPPLDAAQQEILGPIVFDPRVQVVFAPMDQFNYSLANNVAVQQSAAPLICLLNDDVAPITPDWLSIMVGHLQDERIAAVGAKLYYPEATVQHGGVIMGLGGLCDHCFRFLPRAEAGYAARASVEQELSAVTAACMLIRRPVFDAVGGLDEDFASAFNDVDLCLKIREAGYGIVWSAQAELWHYETISFGKHYSDANKPLAERDIGIMRARWASPCAADPFHNPNLSLETQSEWELALPPRLGGLPEALRLVAGG
jgi:GT2 family glycosyltransferase